ncbi:Transglycosylase SLT domain protein [compost metagenome]
MPIDASLVKWDRAPSGDPFAAALAAEGVTGPLADLARSIYMQESGGGKNSKTSNRGAVGGMQILPGTFSGVADKDWDINDPTQNARAGIRYLKQGYEAAGGDPALAGAFYYGGPGGLEKARRGVAVSDPRNPDAPNTLQYGAQVAARIPKEKGLIQRGVEAVIPSANATEAINADAVQWDEKPGIDAKSVIWDAPAKPAQNELMRQGGLTARAGVKGVLTLPGMASDAITGVANAGLDAYHNVRAPEIGELVTGKQKGFRFRTVNSALDNIMTGAGIPEPRDATERVVQDMASGMAGAGGTVAAGKLLQSAAAPVAQSVGSLFAAGPGIQTISGATSAGASGVTRESGGGAVAQGVAGMAGAFAPGVGSAGIAESTRRLVRGGEAGRQKVAENIKLFEDATGTVPSVGQATERRIPRAVESILAKTPGGAGVMNRSAQQKADAMAASVTKLADELSPSGSAINAGEAITTGVQGFKDGFKAIQGRLYETLDQHIKPGTPLDVSNTRAALAALNEGIPGAPNISEFFKNSKIKGIDAALVADLEAAMAKKSKPFSGLLGPEKANIADAQLPYEAIKKLRTLVGNEIADNSLLADVPRSKWTKLYAALSDDLGVAASQAGPDAEQSFQWANQFTRSQLERLEKLSGIVGKDAPEKVFTAAMSGTAEGNTVLKRVVDAIPKENRKELASAVLRRMGRATNGNQNELGDAFSTETFLTNLNKLSPDSRSTLFGRLGMPQTESKLLEFAKVASNVREGSKVFANPSGTQPALSAQATGIGGLAALVSGNLPLAAAAIGTPVAANRLANRLTNPDTVKWLGRKTEFPTAAITAAELNSLARFRGD